MNIYKQFRGSARTVTSIFMRLVINSKLGLAMILWEQFSIALNGGLFLDCD